MIKLDLKNVKEAEDVKTLPPGKYVCKIITCEDFAQKEYLLLEYDILEGVFKNYYKTKFEQFGFWGGKLYRSYKEAAQPFFKATLTALKNSNPHLKFEVDDFDDEFSLIGAKIGLVLSQEEYIKNDNTIGIRLYVSSIRSLDKLDEATVAPLKKLAADSSSPVRKKIGDLVAIDDGDLPF